jgi:hypothetical protein
MDLLDRYVHAVRSYLPRARRDDIVKELSANILAKLEDKETELGRPLDDAEQEAILKQHGHPMVVAGGYRSPSARHLIGPALFPFFWYTLRIVLGIVLLLDVLVGTGLVIFAADRLGALVTAWGLFCITMPFALGTVTLIFAVLEAYQVRFRFLDEWSPRRLPPAQGAQRMPRSHSIAEVVFGTFVLIVLPVWLHYPERILPSAVIFAPASVWTRTEAPILLLALAVVAQAGLNLVRTQPTRLRSWISLLMRMAGLLLLAVLLQAGQWVVLLDTPENVARGQRLADTILSSDHPVFSVGDCANYSLAMTLVIVGIVSVWHGSYEARYLIRSRLFEPRGAQASTC